MSQFSYQQSVAPPQTNGLAIAGFVCALIGLFATGGLLCPIGLILSLVALGKPGGRGFAIAGVVIGLLGSCGLLLAIILIPAVILGALGIAAVAIALAEPAKMELTADMANIAIAAGLYEQEQGVLPADLGVLYLRPELRNDPWGNPYEYHFIDDDPGFDIVSRGQDGVSGNEDDIYLSKLGETWEGAGRIVAEADDERGTVTLTIGGKVITLHSDEKGGRITIDTGEKVIELKGDERGGSVTSNDKPVAQPPQPATPPDPDAGPGDGDGG